MTRELSARFSRPLHSNEAGFTLIELIVVMVVIGILSAIALPSFLNQANKAKQTEAKMYLGSMNRAQQAYALENSEFANDFSRLGLSFVTETVNYRYSIAIGNDPTSGSYAVNYAESMQPFLKAYTGMVAMEVSPSGEAATVTILCEAEKPAVGKAPNPAFSRSLSCDSSSRLIP